MTKLDEAFDLGELGQMAFNLNLDLEKVSRRDADKIDIIIDLVTHFQKNERLDILIRVADEARPHLEQPFSELVGLL